MRSLKRAHCEACIKQGEVSDTTLQLFFSNDYLSLLLHLHPLRPSQAASLQSEVWAGIMTRKLELGEYVSQGLGDCGADDRFGSSTSYDVHIEGSHYFVVSIGCKA